MGAPFQRRRSRRSGRGRGRDGGGISRHSSGAPVGKEEDQVMKATRLLGFVLLAWAAAAALSCGDRSPLGVTPGAARPPADLLDSLGQTVNKAASLLACSPLAADSATQTIGADGGTIYVGPHTLTIPPGALGDTVTITAVAPADTVNRRSEERREGKRVDLGGRRIIKKKKIERRDENIHEERKRTENNRQ